MDRRFSAGLFALSACPLLTSVQAANADRKQVLQDTYQQWKKTYVTEDTYISSGKPQYYVSYEENRYAGDGVSVPVTVSEAHGYGMLITVCMADYDAQAKIHSMECTAIIGHISAILVKI